MNDGKQGAGQGLLFQLLHEIGKLSAEAHERGRLYIDEGTIATQLGIMDNLGDVTNISGTAIKHSAIDAIASYTFNTDAKIAVHASSNSLPGNKILPDAVQVARDYNFTTTDIIGRKNCGQVSASFVLVHGSTIKFSSIGSNPIVAFNVDKTSKRTSVTLINDLDFPGEMPPSEVRSEKGLDITKFSTTIVIKNTTTKQTEALTLQDFKDLYNALLKKGLIQADGDKYLPTTRGKFWVSDDLINAIERELLRTNFSIDVTQLYNGNNCTQFFLNPDSKENIGEWRYNQETICVGIFDPRILQNSIAKTLSYLNGVFSYCINSNAGTFDITRLQTRFNQFFFGATSTLFSINNTTGTFFLALLKGEKVPFIVVMCSDPAEEVALKLKGALPAIFAKTEFVDLEQNSSTALATTATAGTADMTASMFDQFAGFVMLDDSDKSAVASK